MRYSSIPQLLENQTQKQSDNDAIIGLNNKPISYQQLFKQTKYTGAFLNTLGIGRNDPIVIVLPNGPLMATAFLSVASSASSAPLNPAYTTSEFDFFLSDLKAKAILVEKGSINPVIEVAKDHNLPIISLIPKENSSEGLFSLKCNQRPESTFKPGLAKMSDVALILHTSGTTSRPKMVPLTQKNLCTSANNIQKSLQLTPEDRCLNIMPLFHIHGLMAAVLASISAGGSIVCTPGFYAPSFFDWFKMFQPTWYTAVPTMHQSILNQTQNNLETVQESKIRFIRSSSASLAPNVMKTIEDTFGVPLIEAYGMTEASHQMTSNPLPPGKRKPGSVGLPAGPEIGIMHEDQPALLPLGEQGEVVIRGDNVTLGYMNNTEANQKSFSKGWFRTGDLGYLDSDGYLFLMGRLKEIINRGGEKISPREVDEILLDHPGVLQAVTFGVPDEKLGENIAAAVVIKDENITERDLKLFLSVHLAPHKIPEKIIFLDEIPKGPTGKLQRIGLAGILGFSNSNKVLPEKKQSYFPPKTNLEKTICEIWQKTLGLPKVSIHDQFRDLGGDSMLATLLHHDLETVFGITINLVDLNQATTVSKQVDLVKVLLN